MTQREKMQKVLDLLDEATVIATDIGFAKFPHPQGDEWYVGGNLETALRPVGRRLRETVRQYDELGYQEMAT